MDIIPSELTSIILKFASHSSIKYYTFGQAWIIRLVCKLWRALIEPRRTNYYGALCLWTASMGYLSLLKWARNLKYRWDVKPCAIAAAKGGHRNVLKWMKKQGCDWHIKIFAAAANGGHLELLKWLKENGCPSPKNICSKAVCHPEVMRWLITQGHIVNQQTSRCAVKHGLLDLLSWLQSMGCVSPAREEICDLLAENGHLSALIKLKEYWTERTFAAAAKGGHLEILLHLTDNGCPWNANISQKAAKNGQLEILI